MAPQLALVGNRWLAQDYSTRPTEPITISIDSPAQSVHISNCAGGAVFVLDGAKMAAICVDGCKDVGIIVKGGVMSTVEVVNCAKVKLQLEHFAPNVSIEGSEAISLYLMMPWKDAQKTSFITSKANEVNVVYSKQSATEEMVEAAIPEQFRTVFDADGKLQTTPVQHAGA